ncbi:hypothetical protein D3C73_1550090 [compost metagenome]
MGMYFITWYFMFMAIMPARKEPIMMLVNKMAVLVFSFFLKAALIREPKDKPRTQPRKAVAST